MKQKGQLSVMLYVSSVDDARAFYTDKLGFRHMMGMLGKDGLLDFCSVELNGARLMLMRPGEGNDVALSTIAKQPIEFYLEVGDVDAYHDTVTGKKVQPATPLTDQWWGDRTFTVVDPFGYKFWFYQTVAEAQIPQGAKVV